MAAVKKTMVKRMAMKVSLTAYKLNASSSFNRNRAVESKTIMANARMARLLRKTSGKLTRLWPW